MDIGRLIRNAKLPSPAPVMMAIFDAMEHRGAEDMARILEADPALCARLLKLANSAYYGQRSVNTVQAAIVKVGTIEVTRLIVSTEVMQLFAGIPAWRFNLQAFWEHSLRTACLSSNLSRLGAVAHLAPLWLYALLHDVGKLLLLRAVPVEYADVLNDREQGASLLEAEQHRLGCTHAEVGGELFHAWHLPEGFVRCARHHHEDFVDLNTPESIVSVANRLEHQEMEVTDLPGLDLADPGRLLDESEQMYAGYRKLFAGYLT